jgi:hypothetical protein
VLAHQGWVGGDDRSYQRSNVPARNYHKKQTRGKEHSKRCHLSWHGEHNSQHSTYGTSKWRT